MPKQWNNKGAKQLGLGLVSIGAVIALMRSPATSDTGGAEPPPAGGVTPPVGDGSGTQPSPIPPAAGGQWMAGDRLRNHDLAGFEWYITNLRGVLTNGVTSYLYSGYVGSYGVTAASGQFFSELTYTQLSPLSGFYKI